MFNVLHDLVHPEAKVVYGSNRGARFPYLDESADHFFAVGYHAMAGTMNGVLEHTMSSEQYFRVTANGRPIGELAIDAGIAGLSGVPAALVTGDDKMCAEGAALLGCPLSSR